MESSGGRIKTRILIISDTHSLKPKPKDPDGPIELEVGWPSDTLDHVTGFQEPLPAADVALHCGDLTMKGTTNQFQYTFDMLRALPAPLKLVIAGNHDLLLDEEYWNGRPEDDRYNRAEMWRIIKDAEVDGVKYLTEGTHTFDLANGARLTVYASQYTPAYGNWAFQYREVHRFEIPHQVDIAMTHGPPKHIFDLCKNGSNAGCTQLFEAVREAKPRVHCFGHIHESWGALLAKWRQDSRPGDDAAEALDLDASKVVLKNEGFEPGRLMDSRQEIVTKLRLGSLAEQRGPIIDTTDGEYILKAGDQTLFVNAAIMDWRYRPSQLPWTIDMELAESPVDARQK